MFSMIARLAIAQSPCQLSLSGTVENGTQKLSGATVIIKCAGSNETDTSVIAGTDGKFVIAHLCAGNYFVRITYIEYDTLQQAVSLAKDTAIHFLLNKQNSRLQGVTVTTIAAQKRDGIATLSSTDIKGEQLFQTRGATLGESLKAIPGLNSIQTGPSISKPVIHGLHSNRVLILNNGVRQEGQQWGAEHAPEIDPFIASKITVIKGAASVRYGSDALVGVVLLEPERLTPAKALEGEANVVAATNGRMGVASAMLQGKIGKKPDGLSWRAQGTLKRAGNFRTANYYLENTGLFEGDYSLNAAYTWKNFGMDVYYSEFHNKIGIFSGSHVGNEKDLDSAFKRPVPITPSYFSYKIDRTYQNVTHDLLKADAHYNFTNGSRIEAIFGSQKNLRREYDIDIPYSSDAAVLKAPQISFQIKTQTLDLIYEQAHKNNFEGSFGINTETQGNVFKGIRYLIPNFRNYGGGVFGIEKWTKNNLTLEAGARYDYRWLRVYRINNTSLQTYHNTLQYNNATGTIGASYRIGTKFSVNGNIGSAWRAPSISELYIDGIHLSAASYERGDSTLQSEQSYNFTVSGKYESNKLAAEVVLYDNIINHFIYAKPTLQPITLISGSYPYFKYTQEDVNLKGIDADITYKPVKQLSVESKTSLLWAWNRTIHDYLVFMPANRFDNTIKYLVEKFIGLQDAYISVQNVSVARQSRVPPNSDYVAPPAGYSLLNANIGFTAMIGKKPLNIDLGAYNLTNVSYRDYLNRFRYYADDLGINIVLKTRISF